MGCVEPLSQAAARIRKEILDAEYGKEVSVLFETYQNNMAYGHTPNFIEVACPMPHAPRKEIHRVKLLENDGNRCHAILLD